MSIARLPSILGLGFGLLVANAALATITGNGSELSAKGRSSCHSTSPLLGCSKQSKVIAIAGLGTFHGRCEADAIAGVSRASLHLEPEAGVAQVGSLAVSPVSMRGRHSVTTVTGAFTRAGGNRVVSIRGESEVRAGFADYLPAEADCRFRVFVSETLPRD